MKNQPGVYLTETRTICISYISYNTLVVCKILDQSTVRLTILDMSTDQNNLVLQIFETALVKRKIFLFLSIVVSSQ